MKQIMDLDTSRAWFQWLKPLSQIPGFQFFIMPDDITEHDWLNGVHTVFGKVISGCEHVTTLSEVDWPYDRPVIPVIITSATVSE